MFKLFSKSHRIEDEALRWVARLQSPSLTSQQEALFFSWLDISTAHQAAYVNAEAIWQQGHILESIPREEDKTLKRKRFDFSIPAFNFPKIVAPVATAGVLVLLFGLELLHPFNHTPQQDHETQTGERQEVVLDDGSRLILNTNASITVSFNRDQRLVKLNRGEVYFDIEKDKNRPFNVLTASGSVRVLGTQFSVFDNKKDVIVTVVEGKVSLSNDKDPINSFLPLITLTKDQRLSLGQANAKLEPVPVNAESKTSWVKNKLVYQGETLKEVVRDINRYYQSKLILGDEALSNKEVVAVLQLDDFSSTLNALKSSLNLKSSVDPELQHITLSSR